MQIPDGRVLLWLSDASALVLSRSLRDDPRIPIALLAKQLLDHLCETCVLHGHDSARCSASEN